MTPRCLRLAIAAMLCMTAGCAPHVPGIADPIRVAGHCAPRQPRITAIRSVVATTNDRLPVAGHPALGDIQAAVSSGDGAIAYWNDQRLKLPTVAQELGERSGYAHVRAVAIPPAPAEGQDRTIYLFLRDHGHYQWFTMQAFDRQDICVEGHIQS